MIEKLVGETIKYDDEVFKFELKDENEPGGDAPWKLTRNNEMVAYVESFIPIIQESGAVYFRCSPYKYRIRDFALITAMFDQRRRLTKFSIEFDENQVQLMGVEIDNSFASRYRCKELTFYRHTKQYKELLTWERWFQPGDSIILDSSLPVPKGFE